MSEYSVEEVRSHSAMLRDCRINTEATRDKQQDRLADICDAYADLLERIEADEGAVPVAFREVAVHEDGTVSILYSGTGPSNVPRDLQSHKIEPLFIHAPAQAAQVSPEPLRPGYVKCLQCDAQIGGYGYGEFPKLCPVCQNTSRAPTALPVAQLECPKCHGTGEVSDSDGLYAGQCAACRAAEPVAKGETVACAPSTEAAEAMGAKGGPAVEAERLAFEAWMKGHCWTLGATWSDGAYRSDAEQGGKLCPHAVQTRCLWAAWRDRAALAAQPRAVPDVEAKYKRICDAFDAMKTSTSERFLECLGIDGDVFKPLDELLATPSPGESA